MKTRTWRPGLAWKNDKFYSFEANSALVMRMWPEMRAWRRTKTRPWSPTRKWADQLLCRTPLGPGRIERVYTRNVTLVGPRQLPALLDSFLQDSAAALAAISSIPERERAAAESFQDRRWHALALMARCEWATDLVEANPALGFALASNWILHQPAVAQPLRAARALLKKPQVQIMEWLGFPATERVRRILMRISSAALKARKLPQLNTALHRPHCQELLAHLPMISEQVLRYIYCPDISNRLTPKFVHQVAAQGDRERSVVIDHHFRLWLDAACMAKELDSPLPEKLQSIAHLTRWHGEMTRVFRSSGNSLLRARIAALHFCAAPLQGTLTIEPIISGADLLKEGLAMSHCVASRYGAILEGNYFVYRVTDPIRATLGLRQSNGCWVVDQIKGYHNQEVAQSDQEAIWRTLTEAAGGRLSAPTLEKADQSES